MKKTFTSPLMAASAVVAFLLSGCATAPAGQHVADTPMQMGSTDKGKTGKSGCSCCGKKMEGMSADMKSMGIMRDKTASTQGDMCMTDKSSSAMTGCSCCGMGEGGCACCGTGKK